MANLLYFETFFVGSPNRLGAEVGQEAKPSNTGPSLVVVQYCLGQGTGGLLASTVLR